MVCNERCGQQMEAAVWICAAGTNPSGDTGMPSARAATVEGRVGGRLCVWGGVGQQICRTVTSTAGGVSEDGFANWKIHWQGRTVW